MHKLDFLKKTEWHLSKKDYISYDRIRAIEEEYWWIDESETVPQLVSPDEFYSLCLQTFAQKVTDAGFLGDLSDYGIELIPVGEKVVFEALYDRYLVQRHESDPDIFYNYVVQLAFESGMATSDLWFNNSTNLEKHVDKIIRETPYDYTKTIYQEYFHFDDDMKKTMLVNRLSSELYDLLKWYYKEPNFEAYKLKALLAAFYLGVVVIAEKNANR